MNLGPMIDQLWKLKEAKDKAAVVAKTKEDDYKTYEKIVIEAMTAAKTTTAGGKLGKIERRPALVVNMNWDLFYPYMYKNKTGYLLERRPATLACRELLVNKGYSVDADGELSSTPTALKFTELHGIAPFVKFTTTLKEA